MQIGITIKQILIFIGAYLSLCMFNLVHAAEFTLRAVANSNENDEDYDGLVVFKCYVESRSNGRVDVDIYMGTQLCSNGGECLESLEYGSIDIYISTAGGASSMYPYVQVLDLPYIFRDDRVAEEVLSGGFTRELREQILVDSNNIVRLMTIGNTGGWRNFANTKRVVKTPNDLNGLKIRTIVSDLPQELVSSLGASPTPVPWGELHTSLQTGAVEGSKNGITDIVGAKLTEAGLKYITLDGHAYMSALWYMNNDVFMDMPKELRQVVVDGFSALQQATFASPKQKSIEAYKEFEELGGELYVPTPLQKAEFRKAVEPVYSWFRENINDGDKWLSLLNTEVKKAEGSIQSDYSVDLK